MPQWGAGRHVTSSLSFPGPNHLRVSHGDLDLAGARVDAVRSRQCQCTVGESVAGVRSRGSRGRRPLRARGKVVRQTASAHSLPTGDLAGWPRALWACGNVLEQASWLYVLKLELFNKAEKKITHNHELENAPDEITD